MAAAVVGGINELVLLRVESGSAHRLSELTDTAAAFLRAVLGAPAASVATPPRARKRSRPR
jgi:hypothetical protein